jgi:hypothetical protein
MFQPYHSRMMVCYLFNLSEQNITDIIRIKNFINTYANERIVLFDIESSAVCIETNQYINIIELTDEHKYKYLPFEIRLNKSINNKPFKNEDISIFGNVHTLDLRYHEEVTDVSALGNVHKLNLSYCYGVTDVSALGKVNILDIRYCTGITDVSALGKVHTLILRRCTGVTDVSALGNVHTLDLSYCTGITDVSALGNVHTLDLTGCTAITDYSALTNVKYLYK